MTNRNCPTLKGVAGHGWAAGQTEHAPPPYSPPFRGGVRVGQERSSGGAVERSADVCQSIAALASRIERLTVSHRDPEAFFIERSDIARELRAVARVPPPLVFAGRPGRSVSLAGLDFSPKVSG